MAPRQRIQDGRSAETRRAERTGRPEEANPFLENDQQVLPHVPDDERWSYKWMRCSIIGEDDGRNVVAHYTGRLTYQPVKPEDFPELLPLSQKEGGSAGRIVVNDCMLVKVPIALKRLYEQACDYRADRLAGQLEQQVRGDVTDSRARLVEYEHRTTAEPAGRDVTDRDD